MRDASCSPSAFPSTFSLTDGSTTRALTSNGIPDHPIGAFPNTNNPNAVSQQAHAWTVPLAPSDNPTATDLGFNFGMADNGVPFRPYSAEYWNNDPNSG